MCIWYDMKYIKMIYMWMNNMMSDVTGLWALYNNRMSLILSKWLQLKVDNTCSNDVNSVQR